MDDDLYVANGQELGDYLDWMFGANPGEGENGQIKGISGESGEGGE